MDILHKIAADKKREVELRKQLFPIAYLESSVLFEKATVSLSSNLQNSETGIIAEHKRRSPSKPVINVSLSADEVVRGYVNAGACGISVLTDSKYFGGSTDDLLLARASTTIPLLRKEFIVDEFQLVEAKAFGADAILLIAALLSASQIKKYSALAKSLELEILLEVHNLEELQTALIPQINLVGVNNRNLKTFEVSLETSAALAAEIPDEFVKISESGISDAAAVAKLRELGYRGFLIGETFMKTNDPGKALSHFISDLKLYKK
jgi:indole-3-glycerol phosphate synthase